MLPSQLLSDFYTTMSNSLPSSFPHDHHAQMQTDAHPQPPNPHLGLSEQERLRLIEENVTDYAIFTIDVEGRIASWNVGAERILRYQEAEIMGQPLALIFTPEDRAQGIPVQELSKAAATGRAEDERWHLRKDGSRFWASGIMTGLRDEAGNLRAFAKILRDFTQRKQAEDALDDARRRLEATLIAGEIATWTWDIRTNRVIGDKNLARLFSVSPEDANGGPIEHYIPAIHPDDRAQAAATIQAAVESRSRYEAEYRLVKDGAIRWVIARGGVETDAAGNPIRLPGVVLDITARKEAQLALVASEARARRFFEANIVGVIHWNLDTGLITNANDVFLDMVGYTRDDLAQGRLNWQEMTPPEWQKRNRQGVTEIRTQRRGTPYEKEYFRKDGSRVPIIIGGALFDNSPNEGLSFILNISDQKRAERALRQSEERYRSLILASTQIVWATDPQGAMVQRVDSWGEFTGQTQEEYHGWGWLEAIHPEDREYVKTVWKRALDSCAVYACEYRLRHRDGSYHSTSARGVPLLDEQGNIREWIGTNTDITERVQHMEEIENLNARLRRSIQETHHRVKNNLQIISALAELQAEDGEDTVPVTAVKRIGQHTRSLAAIHDLLTQEAKSNVEADSISAREALDKLIPLLQATTGGRPIRYRADDFRLPVREGASLALLVSELVSNAVKHGHASIEVTLTMNGDTARLEVCDDGSGFPADFDWRKAANTGLGLIDSTGRHDLRGTISYENRPEGGARVVVRFPIPQPISRTAPEPHPPA